MNDVVASVIVPCRDAEATVAAALESALASELREIEVIAVDDGSRDGTAAVIKAIAARDSRVRTLDSGGRGVSAARNAGLDAARGEFIFFLDADDAVAPGMYRRTVEAMRRENADLCRVAHEELRIDTGMRTRCGAGARFMCDSPEIIRKELVPCFFGYSFAQVRDWYCGRSLHYWRERGAVYACGFRADVIRQHGVRFDETVSLYEDAMFLCEYLLECRRTTAIDECLYEYRLSSGGSMITKLSSPVFFTNKLRLLERRKAIDARGGGMLAGQYAASCVFSLLEILAASFRIRQGFRIGMATFIRYGKDPVVRASLRGFPLSRRKPVLAVAVLLNRGFFRLLDFFNFGT